MRAAVAALIVAALAAQQANTPQPPQPTFRTEANFVVARQHRNRTESGLPVRYDGTHWHTAQLALAPLAPSDYIIEITNGTNRTLIGFRVVP